MRTDDPDAAVQAVGNLIIVLLIILAVAGLARWLF